MVLFLWRERDISFENRYFLKRNDSMKIHLSRGCGYIQCVPCDALWKERKGGRLLLTETTSQSVFQKE